MINTCGRYFGHIIATTGLLFLALASGCASKHELRSVQADNDSLRIQVSTLNAKHKAVTAERDNLRNLVEADPDKAAVLRLRETKAQLADLSSTLESTVSERDRLAAEAKELQAKLDAIQEALRKNARAESLKDMAVSYVKNEGFELGAVKARVEHDFETYVVLKLEGRFIDGGLMITKESVFGGWSRFSHPSVFWYKDGGFQSIDIITTDGSTDSVSEESFSIDYELKERILEAAQR